jgi:hypothetical protein
MLQNLWPHTVVDASNHVNETFVITLQLEPWQMRFFSYRLVRVN